MGEPRVSMYFAQRINNNLETKAVVPEKDEEFVL